ncbi:MAG: AAA family ATPase [Muribaculaceae bacterium]|nr:AAA family ATPase [Muribaculaceae bacterium]
MKDLSESTTPQAPSTTIIEALDTIQDCARGSRLSNEFWEQCAAEFDYLCKALELSRNQILLLALMCENGGAMSWYGIGEFLGISRLKAMSLTPDLDDLVDKRWITPASVRERGLRNQAYAPVWGVVRALRNNVKFEPENIENLSIQSFVDRLARYMANEGEDSDISFSDNLKWIMRFAGLNSHLPLCREVGEFIDEVSGPLLLLMVADYARYSGTDDEGLTLNEISAWFKRYYMFDRIADELMNGRHELFRHGLIEHATDEGYVDVDRYRLTLKAREELLDGFTLHKGPRSQRSTLNDNSLLKPDEIPPRPMFYNEKEKQQLESLKFILSQKGFDSVRSRLDESGLRRGIACLFYGSPGTGKTETVLQIARETGRPVMRVDIAGMRDKFVGESEKNIKALFNRYKLMCRNCEVIPILFFNEADALIGTRFETTRSSVEKMDNAMQNIILQELETLDGIMIATTNLTGALDHAFDRRFLFKIEFTRPGIEAKCAIWQSMLPELSELEIKKLAEEFDFSGGQIENISRKIKIEYVISGRKPAFDQIRAFCLNESLNRTTRPKVGY